MLDVVTVAVVPFRVAAPHVLTGLILTVYCVLKSKYVEGIVKVIELDDPPSNDE